MGKKLHVLIIDDSEADFYLLNRELQNGDYAVDSLRVDSETTMVAALTVRDWDLFLSDCRLPNFNPETAIKICKARNLDAPFILVSGAVGEEDVVSLLKAGVQDFVHKDNLARLLPAIERGLREADEHRKRVAAEEALINSEEQFRSISEAATDAIIATDEIGLITVWNQGAEQIFGYQKIEIIGESIACLVPAEHLNSYRDRLLGFMQSEGGKNLGSSVELQGIRKNGDKFSLELSLATWTARGALRFSAIIRDITNRQMIEQERVRLQQQTVRSGQLITLGVMATGIAHEVNNPNNSIQFNTAMLTDVWRDVVPFLERARAEDGEFLLAGVPVTEVLETMPRLFDGIKKSSVRIQKTIQNLKRLSRQDLGILDQKVNLSAVVADSVSVLQSQINKLCSNFHCEIIAPIPLVRGNPQQLEQVIINLLLNALQSLPDRGKKVTIKLYKYMLQEGVMIEVTDEGKGISQQHLKLLTDPFFTTRAEDGGTGLGLSISNSIINNHGGQMTFVSQVEQGTTVTVQLPIHPVSQ